MANGELAEAHSCLFGVQQYWADSSRPYQYVPVKTFSDAYASGKLGQATIEQLEISYEKPKGAPDIDPLVRTK